MLPFELSLGQTYKFELSVKGSTLIGVIDGQELLQATDSSLTEGRNRLAHQRRSLGHPISGDRTYVDESKYYR